MTARKTAAKATAMTASAAKVAVADVVHDGKGGFLTVGDPLPDDEDMIASLKTKGFAK